jgi:hypothetical protein
MQRFKKRRSILAEDSWRTLSMHYDFQAVEAVFHHVVWWLESRPFFSDLWRERIWVFWRRVLHTCHHRTQVQTWLRLAGTGSCPAIYGPSGDVKWDEADPTYSLEAAKRGG